MNPDFTVTPAWATQDSNLDGAILKTDRNGRRRCPYVKRGMARSGRTEDYVPARTSIGSGSARDVKGAGVVTRCPLMVT